MFALFVLIFCKICSLLILADICIAGNSYIPRIHDGGEPQFGGQRMRQKYRIGMPGGPIPRPPVHLRTAEGMTQQVMQVGPLTIVLTIHFQIKNKT